MNAPAPRSRMAEQRARGVTPAMPPISEHAGHLLGWWLDVGPTMAAGMGDAEITYSEIGAWSKLTGTPVEPWEAQLLRRLSGAYIQARNDGADSMAIPPWHVVAANQKQAAGRELSARLTALAAVHEQEAARRAQRSPTLANLPHREGDLAPPLET